MIERTELKQVADLAKLSITEDKLDETADDLNNILKLAEQLSQADTDKITPMAHPLDMPQRLRPDEVSEDEQLALFQSIAPKTGNQHYLVPTVIK